jgi:TonB family protein
MLPQPKARPEFSPKDSNLDPIRLLEQHMLAGFLPDLALDLVLNVIVVHAAEATHSAGAALGLLRDGELVCRASTGHLGPELSAGLKARSSLSGACLATRQPQVCVDTEFDPGIDPAVSRELGVRSILAVPVLDLRGPAQIAGVLEVYSEVPAAFSSAQEKLLQGFAEECARVRQAALQHSQTESDAAMLPPERLRDALFLDHPAEEAEDFEASEGPDPLDELAPVLHRWERWKKQLNIEKKEAVATSPPEPQIPEPILGPKPIEPRVSKPKPSAPTISGRIPERMIPELVPSKLAASPAPGRRPLYEIWTLILASLAVIATVSVLFVMGSRVGWFGSSSPQTKLTEPVLKKTDTVQPVAAAPPAETRSAAIPAPDSTSAETLAPGHSASPRVPEKKSRPSSQAAPVSAVGDLVVYEKGKVIFRLKSTPEATSASHEAAEPLNDAVVDASSTARIPNSPIVWISPAEAERRLVRRTEPFYPAAARAAHRSGDVVLEVQVTEDGAVAKVRTVRGDRLLAAAAVDAVRKWRYQPYRQQDRPAKFQTDVTLSFALPN